MEMKAGLQLRMLQTQKLVMTPQLQQALKLLQMPSLELQQILKMELMMNPVLEEVDELEETPEERLAAEEKEKEKEEKPDEDREAEAGDESREEIDWDEYFHSPQEYGNYRQNEEPLSDDHYERVPSTTVHLSEHMLSQLRIVAEDEEIVRIGEFLIGSLDDRGYLTLSVEEAAESVGASVEEVEKALRLLQTFDPSGVGARDLRECLLIQLDQDGRRDTRVWRIVHDHFDDLVQNRYMDLAKKLKTTPKEIQAAAAEIGRLNPRPGMLYSAEDPRYIAPDLVVDRVDEEYVVYLNDHNVPRLRVSRAYESMLSDGGRSDNETRDYIRSKLNAANQLINTIERRRRTMVKVMNAIVENQRDFFDHGIRHLRPLTLQQVAEQIGMHESTVSRVTSGKYVQTPRGVFELKFFFSSGIRSDSGEDVSAKRVKDRVREMVEKEEKKKPLSDQKIVDILKKEGLIIARRTVAKYREQMGILSARYRKEF
ncbi:MAG: RNA polymerase factor sigma-54 [Candidatus Eisenbacteria bacterium]|nr:RNA polymerase factor sigma-54 [Candidatus Eisenbacteria bacterium]